MAEVSTAQRDGWMPRHNVSLRQAFDVWVRVALLSFGGPAGQIAVMHRILVEEKRWISESRFLHALNYCMLLPGPEAQQLATYIGWLMHRTLGGIMAGGLFVLPGIVAIMALSYVYAAYGNVPVIVALFFGLKAAVLAIVLEAVFRIGKRALKNTADASRWPLPPSSAFSSSTFRFPIIVFGAALIGFCRHQTWRAGISGRQRPRRRQEGVTPWSTACSAMSCPSMRGRPLRALCGSRAMWLALWLVPVLALLATLGSDNVFSQIAIFFSKMAMVTFGGAYAVLAYVAQQAVENYGWLKPGEMLDGLGMAETTPGPADHGAAVRGLHGRVPRSRPLSPMLAGTLGGLLATWVTFTPCFLWIFLGAPFIEVLRGNKALNGALSAITAAVVGVILNLAIWFALHTLFRETAPCGATALLSMLPVLASVDPWALALSARRDRRDLPLQGRDDPDAAGVLGRRDHSAPRRGLRDGRCMRRPDAFEWRNSGRR